MSTVVLLSGTGESAATILPSLSLLGHTVTVAPASLASVGPERGNPDGPDYDVIIVDARHDLLRVRELLRQIGTARVPVLAVIRENAWAALTSEWDIDDVILESAGPGEVEARLRLAIGRSAAITPGPVAPVRSGELVIDEVTYSAKVGGTALDLTFKEFELLKFLAQHPRRVFTRSQLLQEVWGYDYFGGTRTVDVHVRRLRAKLGSEHEALIGTVRNVGYKFVPAVTKVAHDRRAVTGRPDRDGHDPPTEKPAPPDDVPSGDLAPPPESARSGRAPSGDGRQGSASRAEFSPRARQRSGTQR